MLVPGFTEALVQIAAIAGKERRTPNLRGFQVRFSACRVIFFFFDSRHLACSLFLSVILEYMFSVA